MKAPMRLPVLLSLCVLTALSSLALRAQAPAPPWREQGLVHTRRSPHARLHDVPVRAVTMDEGFWSGRMRANVERSIPTLLALFEQKGIVDNFRRLGGTSTAPRRGPLFTDSDLYKWMEAAAIALQSRDDATWRATLGRLSEDIARAQEASGYVNTYWTGDRASRRFTEQVTGHEEYCLGHLLQAGIARYRADGDTRLLDVGRKMADSFVARFGPDKDPLFTGHPELELAMIELYRTTGERKYLEFAGYLLGGNEAARLKLRPRDVAYTFSGVPFTTRTHYEGHAVRAMYASVGAADYYMETGDAAYLATLQRLWDDLTGTKMYVTGGVGSRAQGETFGDPYELPNTQAYGESCAAIGNMLLNWRLLLITGEARYADVMERALYNGVNSGMSLDGTLYCYRNPLESRGEPIRNPWYDTTCCPPNLQRTLAALPGYLYSTAADGLYVHFFHPSTLRWRLEDGTPIEVRQQTRYPWAGDVDVTVSPASRTRFALRIRIPGWSSSSAVTVNGSPVASRVDAGHYVAITRDWAPGDRVRVSLDMTVQEVAAHPQVRENTGRVAVQRGPLVYAMEQQDQPTPSPLAQLVITGQGTWGVEERADLLGGVTVLTHAGAVLPDGGIPLYRPSSAALPIARTPVPLTFIPYYAWANREPQAMAVWITRK
jgi:DUF1680 family protein